MAATKRSQCQRQFILRYFGSLPGTSYPYVSLRQWRILYVLISLAIFISPSLFIFIQAIFIPSFVDGPGHQQKPTLDTFFVV